MKSKKKVLVTLLCAVLLVFASVMGTMAYLTDDAKVTNTFTVGDVVITMDETDVDLDGEATGEPRDTENRYKLMPGHTYIKDPIVHVDENSEDCYLFVKLENGLKGIIDVTTVEDQMIANGWICIDEGKQIYKYKEVVSGGTDVNVFANFKVKGDEVTDLAAYDNKTIVVTAYAVQEDGFDGPEHAWNATFGK